MSQKKGGKTKLCCIYLHVINCRVLYNIDDYCYEKAAVKMTRKLLDKSGCLIRMNLAFFFVIHPKGVTKCLKWDIDIPLIYRKWRRKVNRIYADIYIGAHALTRITHFRSIIYSPLWYI